MTEFVWCVGVRVACREGKDRWGNRQGGIVRRRGDRSSKIANAKVIALRLRDLSSGIFIGWRSVPLRMLTRDDRSWCESCVSVFPSLCLIFVLSLSCPGLVSSFASLCLVGVFLGARDEALSLLEQVSRNECGSCSSGFIGQG